ncbi:hypothetical protein IJ118_01750 [Candidatus Saccharibacteria bacterium]|nr:hypothetical protein [Candidatus Saccharibacteria bacterium]
MTGNIYCDYCGGGLTLPEIERGIDFIQKDETRFVAATHCSPELVPHHLNTKWRFSADWAYVLAAVMVDGVEKAEIGLVITALFGAEPRIRAKVIEVVSKRKISLTAFRRSLCGLEDWQAIQTLVSMCDEIPHREIRALLASAAAEERTAGIFALEARINARRRKGWFLRDWTRFERALNDPSPMVEEAAISICVRHKMPEKILKRLWEDGDEHLKSAVIKITVQTGAGSWAVHYGLYNESRIVRLTAARWVAMTNSPDSLIKMWCDSGEATLRTAAMYASRGRSGIADSYILKALHDRNAEVRKAAMYASKGRTFGPVYEAVAPNVGYIPCLYGTILTVEIPETAEVRGKANGGMCRTNEARVAHVYRGFGGGNHGVLREPGFPICTCGSKLLDQCFDYCAGGEGEGIHFFCDKAEAISVAQTMAYI